MDVAAKLQEAIDKIDRLKGKVDDATSQALQELREDLAAIKRDLPGSDT